MIAEAGSGMTTSTGPKGVVRYMSPELLKEDGARHTLSSDIWAWGCVLVEVRNHFYDLLPPHADELCQIAFDLLPYAGALNTWAIITSMNNGQKPAPLLDLELSSTLRTLLEFCWHTDPTTRPSTATCAQALRQELHDRFHSEHNQEHEVRPCRRT